MQKIEATKKTNCLRQCFAIAAGVFIGVACINTATLASKKKLPFPSGCFQRGYSYKYHVLTLTPTAKHHPQSLYFIKNISSNSVKISQIRVSDKPYIMHNVTTIKPHLWSALATDIKVSKFICTRKSRHDKHDDIIDCKNVLSICEFPHSRFGENHRGNYWVMTNRGSHTNLRNAVRYHGVLLVDPKRKDY